MGDWFSVVLLVGVVVVMAAAAHTTRWAAAQGAFALIVDFKAIVCDARHGGQCTVSKLVDDRGPVDVCKA